MIRLLALLLALTAQADIRHVGNGGGEAELLFARIWQNIPAITETCLSSGNPCGLEPGEAASLTRAHAQFTEWSFELVTLAEGRDFQRKPGKMIVQISPQSLYDSAGHALSLRAIEELALRCFLVIAEPEAASLAPKLTDFNLAHTNEIKGFLRGSAYRLVALSGAGSGIFLTLEEEAYDLSPSLEALGIAPAGWTPKFVDQRGEMLLLELIRNGELLRIELPLIDQWTSQPKQPLRPKIFLRKI
jgi:hypothetical protein